MTNEVLVLKHVANEDAGTIADFLKARGVPMRRIELYRGESLPSNWDGLRAVCIMGGPMNVYQENEHPFLREENTFIQKLLKTDVPVLGVCLGSQLIAKALGSSVYKAAAPEVGWQDVHLDVLAKEDALFRHAPFPDFQVLQWHEDTFDLPKDCVRLASSKTVPHQAYRYRKNVYGLQFHIEVNEEILKDWFKKRLDLPTLLKQYSEYQTTLHAITDRIYSDFFKL